MYNGIEPCNKMPIEEFYQRTDERYINETYMKSNGYITIEPVAARHIQNGKYPYYRAYGKKLTEKQLAVISSSIKFDHGWDPEREEREKNLHRLLKFTDQYFDDNGNIKVILSKLLYTFSQK